MYRLFTLFFYCFENLLLDLYIEFSNSRNLFSYLTTAIILVFYMYKARFRSD